MPGDVGFSSCGSLQSCDQDMHTVRAITSTGRVAVLGSYTKTATQTTSGWDNVLSAAMPVMIGMETTEQVCRPMGMAGTPMSARIVCLHMQARMCISEVSREVTATDQRLGKFPGQYLILVPGIACAVEIAIRIIIHF